MSPQNLQQEIDIIFQLGLTNGFPTHVINRIIEQHKTPRINVGNIQQPWQDKKQRKFIPLTYFNNSSNEIGRIFKKYGYTPAFSTQENCQKLLKKRVGNQTNNYDKPGIYKIKCGSCPSQYIGKTERTIRTRFEEHLTKNNSNVFKHIEETGHNINNLENNVSVCHTQYNRFWLKTLEKYEIRKAMLDDVQLLNVQLDLNFAANAVIDKCCELGNK